MSSCKCICDGVCSTGLWDDCFANDYIAGCERYCDNCGYDNDHDYCDDLGNECLAFHR